jgi:AcrR family transcriptional regulator
MVRTLDQSKRTAILKAARTIFVQDGYASAKMSDIAAEAGVAPGTLYLYFENKETLASAIGEDFFSQLASRFGSIVKKIHDPDGIVALFDWALKIAHEERGVLSMAKESQPKVKSKSKRQLFIDQLADALEDLMSRRVIRQYDDPAALAVVVLSVLRTVIMSYVQNSDDNADALKSTAITMLQHALFDDVSLAAFRLVQASDKQSRSTLASRRTRR